MIAESLTTNSRADPKLSTGALAILFLLLLGVCHSADLAESSGLAALKQAMQEDTVRIEHKSNIAESAGQKPPSQGDAWTFITHGAVHPGVNYNRYLNQPPSFAGNYPSLDTADMGIGFEGPIWGNWYRGNAIRLVIDGKDIFREKSASRTEFKEGVNGYLKLIWELAESRSVTLTLAVPNDGRAVYAKIDLVLPGLSVESIRVNFQCYPGGYAPVYKMPSNRWVSTAQNEGEVPEGVVAAPAGGWPRVPFTVGEEWIFLADKLQNNGALGLLVLPEEKPSGAINLSHYGVYPCVDYPGQTRTIHLGFYAFDVPNQMAKKIFLDSLCLERKTLKNIYLLEAKK